MSSGAAPTSEVDATSLIKLRTVRQADYLAENTALGELAQVLAEHPAQLAQALVEAVMRLTGAHSAGLSLEEEGEDRKVFRWIATAGEFKRYLNGTLPRDFSPCGVVLDRDAPVLMQQPVRRYGYISDLHSPVQEVLLVPFHRGGVAVGTIWAITHNTEKLFDAEDLRIAQGLSRFAAAAVQTVNLLDSLQIVNDTQREALDVSESSLKKMNEWFQQAPGFVAFLTGPHHTFELANQAYCDIVGATQDELLGKPLLEALPELRGQGFDKLLDEVKASGQPYVGKGVPVAIEYGLNGPRVTKYVDFVYQPHIEHGRVQGVFVQGHECTERMLAIGQLQEDDQRKDDFITALVHEMRTPLTAMALSIRALKGQAMESQGRTLGILDRQSTQLAALVDDMTDVAAIRNGKFDLRLAKVSIQDVINRAVEACDALVKTKCHSLQIDIPSQVPVIEADLMRLTQVMVNLINNAAKYTPEGGHIYIAVAVDAERVHLSVNDTGTGIDAQALPYVFEMFMQVPLDDRPRRSGMGIGLSIVRQLVELHKGTVQASSEGLGLGSTFTVSLPYLPRS